MPSVADYLQRGVAVSCILVSIWGASAGISGHNQRMARAKEAAASMTVNPDDIKHIPAKPIGDASGTGTGTGQVVQDGNPT